MKKEALFLTVLTVLTVLVVFTIAFASTHDPWDGTKWDVASPDIDQAIGNHYKELYDLRKGVAIRVNKEHETLATSSAGGVHKQGSARAFFQDAAPATQVNGDAFDSGDLGLLWFDSNASPDNQLNVLTATTPTWTPVSTEVIAVLLASNRVFAGTLGVTGDFAINTNKFTVTAASGNTLIAGTLDVTGAADVTGALDVTGNIDPTSYETTNGGFLDEDNMASDSATKVASQQSIKAYVDASSELGAWGSKSNNTAYLAATDGFVISPNATQSAKAGYSDGNNPPTTLRAQSPYGVGVYDAASMMFPVRKGDYYKVTGCTIVYWLPLGN